MAATLADAAASRQKVAHRPGTVAGREATVRLFIAFCRRLHINYKRITYATVCWYIEYLASHAYTPGAISNHVAHLRTFYKMAGLNDLPLYHYKVGLALRAVAITIRHVPNPKLPVTPQILRQALAGIHRVKHPKLVAAGLIITFMGFLRQSTLAPATLAKFDPTRHLTKGDVAVSSAGVTIRVKWTKTIQKAADARSLYLPATHDPALCPVKRVQDYLATAPPTPSSGPFLTFPDGNPVTTRYLAGQWASLLKQAGLPITPYSLHSLRWGAAHYTYNHGKAKLNDVMTHGTWRSLSVRDYIKPVDGHITSVHEALQRL